MAVLLKLIVVFTIVNSFFFLLGIGDNGFISNFINTDTNTLQEGFTSTLPESFFASNFLTGLVDTVFKIVDAVAIIAKAILLIISFLASFILFSLSLGMPQWFILMVALPYTAAYFIAVISFIRGTIA